MELKNLTVRSIIQFRSNYNYIEILRGFVEKEIRGRFAGSMGGIAWALINPALSLFIYYYIFSIILKVQVTIAETGTDNFFIFFLSGFFPWIIFAESLTKTIGILIENANIITKVVFPIELLHVGAIISVLLTHASGILLFFIYLTYEGYFHFSWLSLVVVFVLQIFFIWGISFFLSALCVFFRDIKEIFGIAIMVWFYATPIIYPSHMVPNNLSFVLKINPMALFVDLYREIILVHAFPWGSFFEIIVYSLIFFVGGFGFFLKTKPAFGDVL